MDGTRMGSRSSTRHGPAAVFSGPVRRWRKVWAPVSSSSSSTSTSSTTSRILLYKWVPINSTGGTDEAPDEPIPPIVRYMPVSIVLAQRKEALKSEEEVEIDSQKIDDNSEAQVMGEGTDLNVAASESKASELDEADVQEQLNDARNETVSEMLASEDGSPRAGGDVLAMIDEEQNESEPQHESPPGPDLDNAQLPTD